MVVKIETIQSLQGRDIDLLAYLCDKNKPNILIFGMFHGDEPEGEYLIGKMIDELEKNSEPQVVYNLYFVPCLNPDGKALNTRENANKVDINRNFPTANFLPQSVNPHSGTASAGAPASEIETKWAIHLVEKYQPCRILSIHSDLHLVDYDGPAKDLALKMSAQSGYKFVESVGYPTNGSFGTWAGIERKIPLITLETWKAKTHEELEKVWLELRESLFDFCC